MPGQFGRREGTTLERAAHNHTVALAVLLPKEARDDGDAARCDRCEPSEQGGCDLSRGWLGDDRDHGGLGVLDEEVQREVRHQTTDVGGQIPTSDADQLRDSDTRGIEKTCHLLRAGSRGSDDADRTLRDRVGESERHAIDDGGAAVRPHHKQPLLDRQLLESKLLGDVNIVGKTQHMHSVAERLLGDDRSVSACD